MADWDAFAADYDGIFLENPQYRDSLERMLDMVDEGCGRRFLDLGCGTGNVTSRLLEKFPEAHITGIDPSEGMRELYAARFEGRSNVVVSAGGSLEIPAGESAFDCVLSNLALHHIHPSQRNRCAAELARVLRPGGTLVYADFFCDVDGPPEDAERCRDIIDKMVCSALYCLDHGAYEMMMVMLSTLPADLKADGEYLTTEEVWISALESAGFGDFEVARVPPEETGLRILRAGFRS